MHFEDKTIILARLMIGHILAAPFSGVGGAAGIENAQSIRDSPHANGRVAISIGGKWIAVSSGGCLHLAMNSLVPDHPEALHNTKNPSHDDARKSVRATPAASPGCRR
jgi:hypothetical protein